MAGQDEQSMTEEKAMRLYLSEEERDQPEMVKAVREIYLMTTPEKMITAIKGTREQRAILVRDPDSLVATAVLGSPSITLAEAEAFAAMRNVSAEVLRMIATSRGWTKSAAVTANLVKNPRTPIGLSLTHLPRVSPRDMKAIAVDADVPEAIRKEAQRLIEETRRRESAEQGK